MGRTGRLGIALAVAGMLVGACGGGGGGTETTGHPNLQGLPPLSNEDYQTQLTTLGAEYATALQEVEDVDPVADPTGAAQAISAAQGEIKAVSDQMYSIVAPEDLVALHSQLASGMQNLAADLGKYSTAVTEGKQSTIGLFQRGIANGNLPTLIVVNQSIHTLDTRGFTFLPAS
jgi:hypothetical protein